MHVAQQLCADQFEIELRGQPADVSAVFPSWSALDRFGIVVTGPLGALGASLLLQLAITRFYDVKPTRRSTTPTYPEVHVLHVGGPHGDFSNFDVWPPRKEVRLSAGRPLAVLQEINNRGISRLALPEGPVGDLRALEDGPSLWVEQASALDRLASCFLYADSGTVSAGDVRLSSTDRRVAENIESSLRPVETARAELASLASDSRRELPGLSIPADVERWAMAVEARGAELSEDVRRQAAHTWSTRTVGGRITETYRSITSTGALRHIAGYESSPAR